MMKKMIYLVVTALVVLVGCNKDDSDNQDEMSVRKTSIDQQSFGIDASVDSFETVEISLQLTIDVLKNDSSSVE